MNTENKAGLEYKQFVVFKLREEEYAIGIYSVKEILKLLPITSLPHASDFIEGVVNIRNTVIPVIDLCRRFNLPECRTSDSRIIIVEINGHQTGLIVDAVTEVLQVADSDIQYSLSGVTGSKNFLEGIARYDDRLIILLGMENILNSSEILSLEELKAGNEILKEEMAGQ
ncbi:chemotaxis protein CheW [Candidatus Contubernalis alkaliaceticus]|uniref:chemotaxis protein CheW n=1 Tax=Candidatus Contubernalis alkaliaceticus TaxID=338645 RepID=UPI001F4BD41A|nr:chemotaxis protein CheW [Candidatus Contubernalis alkalaceticus]UNC91629.1 chemotaxis protein CheW [Candidatus Contubernalis alkalaceticus]